MHCKLQVAHFFRADTCSLASLVRRKLWPAVYGAQTAATDEPSAETSDAWALLDTIPSDLAASILQGGPHADDVLASTPERWRAHVLRARLLTADCRLDTVLHPEHPPEVEPSEPLGTAAGSALRGLCLSHATLAAASAALAACPDLQWLQLQRGGLAKLASESGATAAARVEWWRSLEPLLFRKEDMWRDTDQSELRASRRYTLATSATRELLRSTVSSSRLEKRSVWRGMAWAPLAALTQLKALDLSCGWPQAGKAQLRFAAMLSKLSALEHLNVYNFGGQAAIVDAAAHLPRLQTLNIGMLMPAVASSTPAPSALAALTTLHSLDISGHCFPPAELWHALPALPRLRVLQMNWVTWRRDPRSVDDDDELPVPADSGEQQADEETPVTWLHLHRFSACKVHLCNSAIPMQQLAAQRALRELDLFGVSHISQAEWHSFETNVMAHIGDMTALESLALGECVSLQPVTLLRHLTRLTHLELFVPRFHDEAAPHELLAALPALRALELYGLRYQEGSGNVALVQAMLLPPTLESARLSLCGAAPTFDWTLADVLPGGGAPLTHLRVLDVMHLNTKEIDRDMLCDWNGGLPAALLRLPALRVLHTAATHAVAAAAPALVHTACLQELELDVDFFAELSQWALFTPKLVEFLSGLKGLPSLRVLRPACAGTALTSALLDALASFESLEVLDLRGVLPHEGASDADVDTLLPALPRLQSLRVLAWRMREKYAADAVKRMHAAVSAMPQLHLNLGTLGSDRGLSHLSRGDR